MEIFTKTNNMIPRFITHSSDTNICCTKALNIESFHNENMDYYTGLYSILSPQNHHCHLLHFILLCLHHFTASCIRCLSPPRLTSRTAIHNPRKLEKSCIDGLEKSHMNVCLQTYQLLYEPLFLPLLYVGHQFSLFCKSLLQSLHQHIFSVKIILQYLQK